jgi:PhoH-like ATPase
MQDPHCIGKIEGDIYIPITVLEELDNHKKDNNEIGKNCREFARILNKIDDLHPDRVTFLKTPSDTPPNCNNDTKIIFCTKEVSFEDPNVILLTNDLMMKGMAKAYGVISEPYEGGETKEQDEIYSGITEDIDGKFSPNEYLVGGGLIERFDGERLVRIPKDRSCFGIVHKNLEQRCALDSLMNDDIKLVTINGKAGSGKTLISLAAALEKTISENKYKKILVCRPIIPMGNEIGFLPGTEAEKLDPWMRPIYDNLEFLFGKSDSHLGLVQEGIMSFQSLTYIRGRSIPNEFIIIDEAQNISKHEAKAILTRAGHNTKIVLVGDIQQIDTPKLDSVNNGLSYIIEKFRNQKIASHITLKKTERSELADISSDIL